MGKLVNTLSQSILNLYLGVKTWFHPVAFGVAAIVEDEEGHILLVRHSYRPGWQLPGGGVGPAEPPAVAIMRELKEEIGLVRSGPPVLTGIFTRKLGWVTNVVALYRVGAAETDFKPSWEIRALLRADRSNLPPDTSPATRRRLAELSGKAAPSPYW